MKSASLAVMALLGSASAVKLQDSMYDPEYYAGLYTNILLDLDSYKHYHGSRNHGNNGKHRDVYDLDPTTVSPYDDMDYHVPASNAERQDWFDEAKKHQNQKIYAQRDGQILHQRTKKDAYDSDPNTASPYDAAANINGGNPHG